ncbi:MAG: glycine cleavage system aminomethyltransferase GcvT [Gemmatimonadetes bacterium]|nr:glycine cleavage system aminomethyltransferase GcvT [Gemmatimonadota bacterium]
MVAFAGFEMPIQYPGGITAEHNIVRNGCGVFDVSHMGEFIIKGKQAIDFVTYVTTNDVAALADGQVHYSGILTEQGTFVDDCLVYRYAADHLMMVVNGSNKDKDLQHIQQYVGRFDCVLTDVSDDIGLLAVQGPKAQEILQAMTPKALDGSKYYWFTETTVAGIPMTLSRTGYTGEDGFELYHDVKHSAQLWKALMDTGRIQPVALGCRDSLRLEMGMALYGNDIDDTYTPLDAGLGWLVKMKKGDFVGRAALEAQKAAGLSRKLVGFTFTEKAIPRHGYPVFVNGAPSGTVMSGIMSPSVGCGLGTAYVPAAHAKEGNTLEVEIRGKRVVGTITGFPFWKRGTVKR